MKGRHDMIHPSNSPGLRRTGTDSKAMAAAFLYLAFAAFLTAFPSQAQQGKTGEALNVFAMGAVGDGKADDTAALQKAIDAAAAHGGEIYLPAGIYRITETLVMSKLNAQSVTIRGQGGSPYGGALPVRRSNTSTLKWDGEAGGTLLRTMGAFGCCWRDLNFDGGKKAGILFLATTEPGWGNMLNSMSNVHFFDAEVGIQMARATGEHCCSDYHFEFITFGRLKTGFLVKNDQGVDFLFNYIFVLGCETLFNFERGGNLQVNTAQLTNCKLFLNIGGGGRNVGTYQANNVRLESSKAGRSNRFQLLKSYPKFSQANVNFKGYNDAQWAWNENRTESRQIPLLDIGPGTIVSMNNCIFNGPVASLNGNADAPASLIMRECSFGFITPENAVQANEHGYFKLLNSVSDKMKHFGDLIKWPQLEALEVRSPTYQGAGFAP